MNRTRSATTAQHQSGQGAIYHTINNCETLLWCNFALFSNICCIGPVKRHRIHILYNMLSDNIFSRFGKHERLMQKLMWCLCRDEWCKFSKVEGKKIAMCIYSI